ncbi:NAD(P)(+) transhydrogenase (Re/Si-specific) subunit beta [Candidatus Methylacidiphilum infernorum]|uniref:NAD(P) transhydrogenase subunit beta n=1 Tax=Candidatus Methylacidiphilum infernorum TaxID=511746 RepID=A0ABX7PXL1_9BACT|nr:NAD(P)(+) transhydrogenase (Re/Si-specific) subunit beta [Candidatus Methylacidiphilum infernorum]
MEEIIQFVYIASAVLFILSLKWMSEVKTSRWGNWAGSAGMALAIVATLLKPEIHGYLWIAIGIVLGASIGTPMAVLMPMTAVPQRTALSHAFGALAAGIVGSTEYFLKADSFSLPQLVVLSIEVLLGFLTFTGSLLAFAKLQEILPTRPILYPGRNYVSLTVFSSCLLLIAYMVAKGGFHPFLFISLIGFSLLFGILLVLPIGGADMPTVISILNAYAGLSSSFMGFLLNNKLLIIAGALDGSSGLILSIQMCKAMNRSFTNVLFGGMGQVLEVVDPSRDGKVVKSLSPREASILFEAAKKVIVVPGYGMAAAQAQHVVKELTDVLESKNIEVKFAIHPVAGRMPGHMNVLLAEADVPYDKLVEMEEINPLFPETDIVLVVGANDITNPAAKKNPGSPLYGMPILDVEKAKQILFIKRSMSTGFAGIDNDLFYSPKTIMLFGDAKKVLNELVVSLNSQ